MGREEEMPRPRICRIVRCCPNITYFKPAGIGMADLEEIVLTVDEFEAVRLKDLLGLEQEEAAKQMDISQPTFHRLISSARRKIADAIVNGKAIKIEGGDYSMPAGRGMGRGGFGRRAGGPPTICVCPACGNQQPKVPGFPCSRMKCEKCGSMMVRGD